MHSAVQFECSCSIVSRQFAPVFEYYYHNFSGDSFKFRCTLSGALYVHRNVGQHFYGALTGHKGLNTREKRQDFANRLVDMRGDTWCNYFVITRRMRDDQIESDVSSRLVPASTVDVTTASRRRRRRQRIFSVQPSGIITRRECRHARMYVVVVVVVIVIVVVLFK